MAESDGWQMVGVCLSRKPWLNVVEFMEYKDLGLVLRTCKKANTKLRLNELLTFPAQIVEASKYLIEVCLPCCGLSQVTLLLAETHCVPRLSGTQCDAGCR